MKYALVYFPDEALGSNIAQRCWKGTLTVSAPWGTTEDGKKDVPPSFLFCP
jgi:hypothetical protein